MKFQFSISSFGFSLRDAARATFSFPYFFSFRLSETEGGGKRSGKKDESFRIPKTAEFRSATSSAIRNDACTSFVLLAFARSPLEYVNPRIYKRVSDARACDATVCSQCIIFA